MSHLIKRENLSNAWLAAMDHLLYCELTNVNLCVQIDEPGREDAGIRRVLDSYLRFNRFQAVQTVANTIFPERYYHPKLGDRAREHFYQLQSDAKDVMRRLNRSGTYIERLTEWPGSKQGTNQLEETVLKLRRQLSTRNPKSSIYELSLSPVRRTSVMDTEEKTNGLTSTRRSPEEMRTQSHENTATSEPISMSEICDEPEETPDPLELHIYSPGRDKKIMGFPCLSYISLTLVERRLHMTAVYRNQDFVERAYGNYLGLSRLLHFMCTESACEPGEILCVATHAFAEGGKRRLQTLIDECHRVAGY